MKKCQNHAVKWVTNEFGYKRVVPYKSKPFISILFNAPTGPRRIDTALAVKKARERIKEYASDHLLFKF